MKWEVNEAGISRLENDVPTPYLRIGDSDVHVYRHFTGKYVAECYVSILEDKPRSAKAFRTIEEACEYAIRFALLRLL